ncbi:Crp/Fnr family transcriptional regulator [Epilithonimonas hungarica]|uniref:CRP/FNR family transcriptional regulator, anaerobic regulatory protein n=1 Tax=Epilithonimonas hungarica TaxID=454006 RepID=A0A1G7TJY1_9FLAO|nr:Crp/Fnr family transcriptional regulator [Epilithonimonas hungarica]MPS75201.1 Crp/Fnr family transcriptional regulator [Chryseobacterium sp.]PZU26290.1 MAG: Crp/Fnr family transcriptional regulator [Chryseobacterium sp.]SDG34820.1 CRP/FNR family transcriptional regulator, anaerobic regulatory protein [Epilithonimonas hungarica]
MNIYEIVDPEFKKEITESRDLKLFPAGTVILDIDSYVNYIPLVMSGSVKVVRTEEDGREILLYYLTPGESCISSILSGLTQDTSKVKAVVEEDAEILMLSLVKAKEWLTKYPEWSTFVFELYHKRFEDLVTMVNSIAFQKVDARILYLLDQKSQLYKSKELNVTHQQLADELGITREAVSRVLKQIETDGKIKLSRNKITLL